MNSLPPPFGDGALLAWRLDREDYARTWNSGEGAFLFGGRWNGRGVRAVYLSLDPATAIIEVAAHIGFTVLDRVRHVLTCIEIIDPIAGLVLKADTLPDKRWLRPGAPAPGQQAFGDSMLAAHAFLILPSAVSSHSWNLVLRAGGQTSYRLRFQEPFVLDPRLNPDRS